MSNHPYANEIARERGLAGAFLEGEKKKKEAEERKERAWYKRTKTPPRRNWGSNAPAGAAEKEVVEVDIPDRVGKIGTDDLATALKEHLEDVTYRRMAGIIAVGSKVKIEVKGGKVIIRSEGADVAPIKKAVRKAFGELDDNNNQKGGARTRRARRARATRRKSRG